LYQIKRFSNRHRPGMFEHRIDHRSLAI